MAIRFLLVVGILAANNLTGANAEVNYVTFPKGYSRCYSKYVDWKNQAHHAAAFAISPYTAAGQDCGSSSGLGSKTRASATAMAACRRDHNRNLASACFVYDIR